MSLDPAHSALLQQLVDREYALVRSRFSLSMGRLQNTSSISVIRKDIARLRTKIRATEIELGLVKGSLSSLATQLSPNRDTEAAASGGFLDSLVDSEDASE